MLQADRDGPAIPNNWARLARPGADLLRMAVILWTDARAEAGTDRVPLARKARKGLRRLHRAALVERALILRIVAARLIILPPAGGTGGDGLFHDPWHDAAMKINRPLDADGRGRTAAP